MSYQIKRDTMTYEEFKAQISKEQHVPDYWQQILNHAEDILLDIGMQGQLKTAYSLGITQPKLSIIKHLLIAYISMPSDLIKIEAANDADSN